MKEPSPDTSSGAIAAPGVTGREGFQSGRLVELFERYAADPVAFAEDLLAPPREWQPDLLRLVAQNPRVAVKTCRNAGKTFAAGLLALWYLTTRPGCVVVVVAPAWQQLSFFWTALLNIWERSKLRTLLPGWEALQNELRTGTPGWRIIGLSAEQQERVEGINAPTGTGIMIIYDEAKNVPSPVRDSLVQMTGGHADARELAISTPGRASGWFFDAFTKHAEKWRTMTVSADQIPRLAAHFAEQQAEHPEADPFFQQQLQAQFADADEGEAVLSFESVRRAAEAPKIEKGQWGVWPGVVGFDPAGRGRDYSIAAYKKGPNVEDIFNLGQSQDEMLTVGKLVALVERLNAQMVVCDAAGMGSAMASRLEEVYADRTRRRVEVRRFNGGSRARRNDRFFNLKSELLFHLRARLLAPEPAITLPSDPQLVAQLVAYTMEIRSDGRIRTIDPLPSPDRADAVLLTIAVDAWGPSIVSLRDSPIMGLLGY